MARTVNGIPIEAILKHYEYEEGRAERIPGRKDRVPQIEIVQPDPEWPDFFQKFKSRILAEFAKPDPEGGNKVTVLAVNHVGSTSVPGLPAKPVIDIDLVLSVSDRSAEPYYVPRLEAAGFEFRIREPGWYEHRYFAGEEPMSCNLHVWGPQCPEVERHRIFGDWLRTHEDDLEQYAMIKKECATVSTEKKEGIMAYNQRKEWLIKEILIKAFKDLGYMD